MFNLLVKEFSLVQSGFSIGLDWVGEFAKVIIESASSIGIGIIVFTLVLKAITLLPDIYQRVKMRKQTLIMRRMKPELEKLQKQYANDKNMYNTKMMELYKKNGYSMLGACLPMIVSMVILIVAFSGFNSYARYANLSIYEKMLTSYNAEIMKYCPEIDLSEDKIGKEVGGITPTASEPIEQKDKDGNVLYTYYIYTYKSSEPDKYIYYSYNSGETVKIVKYYVDSEKVYLTNKTAVDEIRARNDEQRKDDASYIVLNEEGKMEMACTEFVRGLGSAVAAETFRASDHSFLWIGNVWYSDVAYYHPIQDYSSFLNSVNGDSQVVYENGEVELVKNVFNESTYSFITANLGEEKAQPNGYFILVAVSIGLMVLSQFVTMKSQKESNQYQTVDGSGAQSQKIMMVMMPLIYAIFAFMYSAAFSIYMTVSSFLAIIITLICNLVIGKIFDKKEEEEFLRTHTRTAASVKGGVKKEQGKRK